MGLGQTAVGCGCSVTAAGRSFLRSHNAREREPDMGAPRQRGPALLRLLTTTLEAAARLPGYIRPSGSTPVPLAGSAHDANADAEPAVDDDAGRLTHLTCLAMWTAGQGHPGDHV